MFIKIDINPEGVGAFRIHFEHSLAVEEDYSLLDGLGDVIVTSSEFENTIFLDAAMEKTVEFLTSNAFHLSENLKDIYAEPQEIIEFDSDTE